MGATHSARPFFTFIGGKGGVGKTTCAAAWALGAARRSRTLLVSTDPASSLHDVLGITVGSTPRRIPGARHLDAVNLDAPGAFDAWLAPRRALLTSIALRGTYLDEEDVTRLLRLSLPGVDEVIGLLAAVTLGAGYDDVVVDTAPTGHSLRLLAAPALLERVAALLDGLQAHHREIVSALRGEYYADSADSLIAELEHDGQSLAALLRNPERTRLTWVTLAEPMALEETKDAVAALARSDLHVRTLIVNRLTDPRPRKCEWCTARRVFEARALAPLRRRFPDAIALALWEADPEPRGIDGLLQASRTLTAWTDAAQIPPRLARRTVARIDDGSQVTSASLVPDTLRWLLVGGKGGVGKTTCAAALAIDLARTVPSRRVLLLSSDPAHSLSDVFGVQLDDRPRPIAGAPGNLHVREIDAGKAMEQFRTRYVDAVDTVFDRITRQLSGATADRAALRQLVDLAPPGVDEVIAIADVAEALTGSTPLYDTILSDTAPTGHALRLLQTPAVLRDWTQALMAILVKYREVVAAGPLAAMLIELSKQLRALGELLSDSRRTQFAIVTRPAILPREESLRLRASLADLGVASSTVIVNAIGAGRCARCRARTRAQRDEIVLLRRSLSGDRPYAIIGAPAVMPPPHGVRALSAWRGTWRRFE